MACGLGPTRPRRIRHAVGFMWDCASALAIALQVRRGREGPRGRPAVHTGTLWARCPSRKGGGAGPQALAMGIAGVVAWQVGILINIHGHASRSQCACHFHEHGYRWCVYGHWVRLQHQFQWEIRMVAMVVKCMRVKCCGPCALQLRNVWKSRRFNLRQHDGQCVSVDVFLWGPY